MVINIIVLIGMVFLALWSILKKHDRDIVAINCFVSGVLFYTVLTEHFPIH